MEPTKGTGPEKYELKWSAEGIDNAKVEASLKAAIVAGLDAEISKGGWPPRTPTGFPKEIKINVRVVKPQGP